MIQRYSFIPVFSCILLGLAWWSSHVTSTEPLRGLAKVNKVDASLRITLRSDLVETLDRVVAYQHYYHSVYGHFTKFLNRIGFKLPSALTEVYDIRVVEASTDRLIVTAFSEVNGKTQDLMSIDQDYQVQANFPVPSPRAEYLKTAALKHLRLLKNLPSGQILAEEGVFKGFFHYSLSVDSKNERIATAEGMRSPVEGVQLSLDHPESHEDDWKSDVALMPDVIEESPDFDPQHTGQQQTDNSASLEEQTYLAQQIFHGEMGRYARTWSELSKIAHFRFEGKDPIASGAEVPVEGLSTQLSSGNQKEDEVGTSSQVPSRSITSSFSDTPLEIEPIAPNNTPNNSH